MLINMQTDKMYKKASPTKSKKDAIAKMSQKRIGVKIVERQP